MSLSVKIKKKLPGFELDVAFECRGTLGILGASGCGKSMTLKSIAGIETPDEGRIVLGERVLYDSAGKQCLKPQKRRVGYLFQDYALFPNMTVEENIASGLKRSKIQKRERTQEMIQRFRLQGQETKYPGELSGGQKQRTALARILAYEPEVLLLDEPFSALDSFLRDQLLWELTEMLKSYPGNVIIVSHNRDELYELSEEILVMETGKGIQFGTAGEVFRKPEYLETARLTGCRNLSRARRISEREVEALDFGCILRTGEDIPADITHVGIRAEDFKPWKEEGENCFHPVAASVREKTLEVQVTFQNKGKEGREICWKLSREAWEKSRAKAVPPCLRVSPEAVLLLRERPKREEIGGNS